MLEVLSLLQISLVLDIMEEVTGVKVSGTMTMEDTRQIVELLEAVRLT